MFGNILIDVDNTLYSSSYDTEELFISRILDFIQVKLNVSKSRALELHNKWQQECTSDLIGIVREYNVSPKEFMDYICAIDMSFLSRDNKLRKLLLDLPQNKYIYTDSSVGHAKDVCKRLGILDCFSGFFSSHEGKYTSKKQIESFQHIIEYFNLNTKNTWLIDDLPIAIENAKKSGFKGILIGDEDENAIADFVVPDIYAALKKISNIK